MMATIETTVTLRPVVMFLIENGPGRSARELALAIRSSRIAPTDLHRFQASVQQACNDLMHRGEVRQEGQGIAGNPRRYYPASAAPPISAG